MNIHQGNHTVKNYNWNEHTLSVDDFTTFLSENNINVKDNINVKETFCIFTSFPIIREKLLDVLVLSNLKHYDIKKIDEHTFTLSLTGNIINIIGIFVISNIWNDCGNLNRCIVKDIELMENLINRKGNMIPLDKSMVLSFLRRINFNSENRETYEEIINIPFPLRYDLINKAFKSIYGTVLNKIKINQNKLSLHSIDEELLNKINNYVLKGER